MLLTITTNKGSNLQKKRKRFTKPIHFIYLLLLSLLYLIHKKNKHHKKLISTKLKVFQPCYVIVDVKQKILIK